LHKGLCKHAFKHLVALKFLARLPHVTPLISGGSPLQTVPSGKLMFTITISTFADASISSSSSSVVVAVVVVIAVVVVAATDEIVGAFFSHGV
jgi:hypothetical protein